MKKVLSLATVLTIFFVTAGCGPDLIIPDEEDDSQKDTHETREDNEKDESQEETIEPTGAMDGPVTVTIAEGENMNEKLTYLKQLAYEEDWFSRDDDTCQYFYKMTADQSYPIEVEDFYSEEVQAALLEILEDEDEVAALTEAIVTRIETGGKEARQICSGRNGVFVISTESHTTMTLTAWDEEALTLEDIETFEGLIDLSYSFELDAIDKKAVVMTGYGDAGHLSWNYYLINTRNNSITKVESCSGSFSSSGERGEEYYDQFTFECEMEYTG